MKPRPLIGVSTGFTDYGDYLGLAFTRPLSRLGADTLVLPYVEDAAARSSLLRRLDGLVLAVGRDIEPSRFGGRAHAASTGYAPARDALELALAVEALEAAVPVLGVCRGMQIQNVALGGTLHPDHSVLAPPANRHPGGDWETWGRVVRATLAGTPPPAHPGHDVDLVPGSRLGAALPARLHVNSYHHQSVDRLGRGVVVAARAPDGVVEAIEVPDARALYVGVQWELQESWQDAGEGLAVFELLVAAARERARARPAQVSSRLSRKTSSASRTSSPSEAPTTP